MITSSRTAQRRESILQAALECFIDTGYDNASIGDICRLSGATVGSVYHHFGDKEGIAASLYEEGIVSYQAGLLELLTRGGPPDVVVSSLVRHHLTWVRHNPDWARYLLQMGSAPATATAHPAVREHNDRLLRHLDEWSAPHAAAGTILDLPPLMLVALLLGPCDAVARMWLTGSAVLDDATIDQVAAAVTRASRPD